MQRFDRKCKDSKILRTHVVNTLDADLSKLNRFTALIPSTINVNTYLKEEFKVFEHIGFLKSDTIQYLSYHPESDCFLGDVLQFAFTSISTP